MYVLALFSILILGSSTGWSDDRPSWFPKTKCSDQWRSGISQNKHIYNAQRDGSYAQYARGLKRNECYKEWAVLVYMEAENDLSPYALLDLYEMEAGYEGGARRSGSTLKSDVLVEVDTAGLTGIRRFHMFQSSTPYNRNTTEGEIKSWTIAHVESPLVIIMNEAKEKRTRSTAERLTRFLDWGMREYPAEHYMVVLWGHGQGWTAAPGDADGLRGQGFGGVLFDHETGRYLDIPTLRGVLADVTTNTLEGRKIDIYASDACLMQMIEVASEIADQADYIVGSTQIQNFLGLPYRRFLYELNSGHFNGKREDANESDAYLVAKMIPTLLKSSMFSSGGSIATGLQSLLAPTGKELLTMSTLSTNDLALLLSELKKLPTKIKRYIEEDPIRRAHLRVAVQNTPSFVGGAKDLNGFLNLVRYAISNNRQGDAISPATQQLLLTLDAIQNQLLRTVTNKQLGTQYETPDMRYLQLQGFSVWLPQTQAEITARENDFAKSKFYQALNSRDWLDLLKTLAR